MIKPRSDSKVAVAKNMNLNAAAMLEKRSSCQQSTGHRQYQGLDLNTEMQRQRSLDREQFSGHGGAQARHKSDER